MFGIIDAIKGFFDFIVSIVRFVLTIFEDLVYCVKILGQTVLNIPSYLGFLPTVVISLFMGAVAVVVVYKVLGRT